MMGNSMVIIEFYKDGCAPCEQMMGVLDELKAENGDKITIHKINVEKNPSMVEAYNVMKAPTLIIEVDGQPVHRGVGVHSIDLLRRKIEPYI